MTIGSVASAASATQAKPMGMEDFLKILLTQLTYQDPLKPMDNQEFMAQMAQFTALEQTQQLNEKMSTLIANQAALQSVGLIGRAVELSTQSGSNVSAIVTALSLSGESPLLTVTTSSGTVMPNISLSQVVSVR